MCVQYEWPICPLDALQVCHVCIAIQMSTKNTTECLQVVCSLAAIFSMTVSSLSFICIPWIPNQRTLGYVSCLPEVPDVEAAVCSTGCQYGLIMGGPLNLKQPVRELKLGHPEYQCRCTILKLSNIYLRIHLFAWQVLMLWIYDNCETLHHKFFRAPGNCFCLKTREISIYNCVIVIFCLPLSFNWPYRFEHKISFYP